MWAQEEAIRGAKPSKAKCDIPALKINLVNTCAEAISYENAPSRKTRHVTAF